MAETLDYAAPSSANAARLLAALQATVVIDSHFRSFAGLQVTIRYDGSASGRETVRRAIADALRAQYESGDVVFADEMGNSDP